MTKPNRPKVRLKPGDKVEVDWGFHRYVATVRHLYGTGEHRRALIEIPVLGASGETLSVRTASVSVDELEPV